MQLKRRLLFFSLLIGYGVLVGFEVLYEHGEVWCTKKNGYGCVCHNATASPEVRVSIFGPTTLTRGDSALYEIYVSGGPAHAAGFNIAVGHGTLSSVDTTSFIIDGELTHTSPREFEDDTVVSWRFMFKGTQAGPDTIFSVANSVDGNSAPTGDRWNYGENFLVNVQEPVSVHEQTYDGQSYSLRQNFPNPFNPKTTLSFVLGYSSFVTLKVMNLLGEEVVTLMNEQKPAGEYSIEWNAGSLPSGIYLCRLQTETITETKKLILMR